MNTLELNIIPSDESYDHQVVIMIDNKNCIEGFLGIDPVVFFKQNTLFEDGELIIGRCGCGEVGCGSKIAKVKIGENSIDWVISGEEKYTFNKQDVFSYLNQKKEDKSWEDLNRRTERLVGEIFENTVIENTHYFDWASCRINDKEVILSYSPRKDIEGCKQELISLPWNGIDEKDAVKKAKEFKNQNPEIEKINQEKILKSSNHNKNTSQ